MPVPVTPRPDPVVMPDGRWWCERCGRPEVFDGGPWCVECAWMAAAEEGGWPEEVVP